MIRLCDKAICQDQIDVENMAVEYNDNMTEDKLHEIEGWKYE